MSDFFFLDFSKTKGVNERLCMYCILGYSSLCSTSSRVKDHELKEKSISPVATKEVK